MSNIGDQKMKKSGRLLGTVGAAALSFLIADPALASGTTAGDTITNNVTVNFQVGGIAQTAAVNSNTFTVDRKIVVTVADADGATTQVSPGQTSAVTKFTVTNSSNAKLDFGLGVVQASGTAGAHSNTDSFDVSNVKLYLDNGDGSYGAGDTLITWLDEVDADTTKTVFVISDVPLSLTTGSVAALTLTATAKESGAVGTQGTDVAKTTGADTANVMDTVFADAAGASDAQYDGKHSASDDYTVLAAALTAAKTSRVVWDPVNLTTNPKAIPGAKVEYCIIVSNAAGSATATGVTVSDTLPATVTYVAGTSVINGTATSGVCNSDGTATGDPAGSTVTGTLNDIVQNTNRTLRFQATIN